MEPLPFTAVVRPRELAAPAAARPGLDLGGFAFTARAGFAAAGPLASALAAAFAADFAGRSAAPFAGRSRFALRLPGRELGRFPSTPPSSVMDGDSSSARFGYTEPGTAVDRVGKEINWLTG